jgi:hypothetical protein
MHNPLTFAAPLIVILGALALLHAYWALGGKWGRAYAVPTVHGRRAFEPSPLATWAVCALLGIAVVLVIGKSGWIGMGPLSELFDVGVWGLSLVFLLRTVGNLRTFGWFKKVKDSAFARLDTWLYSPLCLLIALLAAGLARLRRKG